MRSKALKGSLIGAALMVVAGMSVPAMADNMNVSWNTSDGVEYDPDSNVYFAGIIQYDDTTTNTLYNVLCDDWNNDVYGGSNSPYYVENSETYVQNYLLPVELNNQFGNNLGTNNIANEIAALTAYALSNPANPTVDEYSQLAIWQLELMTTEGLTDTTKNGVAALLGLGTAFWDNYWNTLASEGWKYGELVMPCTNTNIQITLDSCQTQGQMFLYGQNGPPPNLIPEPGSLALFAAGLLGLGLMSRRRKLANGDVI